MSTSYHYWHGKCKWAKVKTPDEEYGKYSIDLFPDEESLEQIRSSGIQVKEKENDEGIFFSLRRDHEKLIKGDLVVFGPPKVVIKKDEDYEPFEGLVGNGSEVTVKVALYDTKVKGKGHRVEVVAVTNLVEYSPDGDTGSSEYPF